MMWKWSDLKELLRKSQDFSSSAVIVWPVVYPTDMLPPEEPHCTVIYLGDVANLDKQAVIDAINETEYDVFLWVQPMDVEYFGPEQDIPVLRVAHPYLYKYNDFITSSLAKRGIESASQFTEYKPHVTISPEAVANGVIPTDPLLLLPVQLWWGDEKIDVAHSQTQVIV